MKIVQGRAFTGDDRQGGVPVSKSWVKTGTRVFLVETVDYEALKAALDALPKGQAQVTPRESNEPEFWKTLPVIPGRSSSGGSMQIAKVNRGEPGVVLDFVIVCSVPVPAGIVSWWPAGGDANGVIGGNHGTLHNGATFAAGAVGQGFLFQGDTSADYSRWPMRPP